MRYSGRTDIRVATLVANRDWPDTRNLIGLFANTVVLRTQIDPSESFRDYIQRVRQSTVEGFLRQDFPFEAVVNALDSDGTLDRRALLQIGFALHGALSVEEKPDPTRFVLLETALPKKKGEKSINPSTFDLTLEIRETSDGFRGYIQFKQHHYGTGTMARLAMDFESVLESVVADPDLCIDEIQLSREDS